MDEITKQLKRILVKLLVTIQSRKFWACVFGIATALVELQKGTIDGPTAIAAIVGLIVAYAGFTAWEDNARTKSIKG